MTRDGDIVGQISGDRGTANSQGSLHSQIFIGHGYMAIHKIVGAD